MTHAKKKSTLVLALSKEELIGALVDSSCASEEATSPPPTCSKTMEIFYAATIIRQELMGVKNNMSWPPTMQQCNDEDPSFIPDLLFTLLAWTIDGYYLEQSIPDQGML